MHINKGKGQLAFFYTASNVLLTPLLFIFFYFSSPPQFYYFLSSIFFIPSFKISQFLLFSLLNLNCPPSPQFYYFPSSTSTFPLLLFSLLHLLILIVFSFPPHFDCFDRVGNSMELGILGNLMCFITHQSKRRYDEDQNKQGNGL